MQEIDSVSLSPENMPQRLKHLRAVAEIVNRLSSERNTDTLCRRAVELGCEQFDIDRMAIWLVDDGIKHMRGTYGIDEKGQLRDEHDATMEVDPKWDIYQVLSGEKQVLATQEELRDHQGYPYGEGWHVTVSIVGHHGDVLGMLFADSLLTNRPWDEYTLQVLRLYALSIGRLLDNTSTLELLQASQRMLQLIMNNIPQSIFWKDQDLAYLGCNRVFARAKGLESPEAIIGKTDFDFSPPEQAERFRNDDRQVLESGQSKLNYQERQITPEGEERWLLTNKVPLHNADDQIVAVMAMYEDVTERIVLQQETQRRLDEALLLNRIFRATASALDPQSVLEVICQELAKAFALPGVGVALLQENQDLLQIVAEYRSFDKGFDLGLDITISDNPHVAHVLEQRVPVMIPNIQDIPGQSKFLKNAQALGIVSGLIVPLVVRDQVIGALGLYSDLPRDFADDEMSLTQNVAAVAGQTLQNVQLYQEIQQELVARRQIEASLRQETMLLNALMSTTTDSIYFKDRQAGLLRVSQAMVDNLDKEDASQIIGLTDAELFPDTFGQQAYAQDLEIMDTGQPLIGEIEQRHDVNGKINWTSTTKMPFYDQEGQVIGLVGITREINDLMESENALRESGTRLSLALEASDAGVWELLPATQEAYFSPRWFSMLGYGPDELPQTYETWASLLHPEDSASVQQQVGRYIQEGSDFALDFRMMSKEGDLCWIHAIAKVVSLNEDGSAARLTGTHTDITERMIRENALRQSETRLSLALEAADAGVWELTPATQEAYFSPRWFSMLGYGPDELPQTYETWASLLHPEDSASVQQQVGRYIQEGNDFALDFRMMSKEGDLRWIHAIAKVVSLNEDGSAVRLTGTHTDITERMIRENALRQSETRLSLALEAADAGVWELTPATQEAYFSPRWFSLLGYGPDELPQTYETWAGLLHPEDSASVQQQVGRYIQEGSDFALDFRMMSKEGDLRWIHAIAQVYARNEDGSAARLIGTHTDVTERMIRDRERVEMYVRRTEEVRLSTQVAQEIAAAPALEELFARVVTLVKERFGYYHTQIFRRDPERQEMVLVVGYGQAGQDMLAEGHTIPLGIGVVGQAALSAHPALAADVTTDRLWRSNPHLPDTRGELAVPIRWGEQVLGILDVQSDRAGSLSEEDQLVLEGLCGQIAIAIQNTAALQDVHIFRELVQGAGQGIAFGTIDGRNVYANAAMLQLIDETELSRFVGQSLANYLPDQEWDKLTKVVAEMAQGSDRWQGEVIMRSRTGRLIPTIHNMFLLRDDQGELRYSVSVVTDTTETKRAQSDMAERLQELNNLYRTISQEGWQAFRQTSELPEGYLFDGVSAHLAEALWEPEIAQAVQTRELARPTSDQSAAVAPLLVPGGESVGVLGVYDNPAHPLSEQDLSLVQSVADQVAQALEGSRLSRQTRDALEQTQMLYEMNRDLSSAQNEDEILQILAWPAIESGATSASLASVEVDAQGEPEWLSMRAAWRQSGEPLVSVGTRFYIPQLPVFKLWASRPDQPVLISDVTTDERLDSASRAIQIQMGAYALVVVPLLQAGRWVGLINLNWSEPRDFTPAEIELYSSLSGLASPVVESQRLLADAQARAQREQQLREISARLRAQPSVDGVMRTLAREVGQALGRQTLVSLTDVESLAQAAEMSTRTKDESMPGSSTEGA